MTLSRSMRSPAGMPSRMTTRARPCDSPAVRNRTMRTLIVYEETAAFRSRPPRKPEIRADALLHLRGSAPREALGDAAALKRCRAAETAVMLLADRYLRCSGCWIDLATARAVLVAVRDAGATRSQIDWAERCAMLSRPAPPSAQSADRFRRRRAGVALRGLRTTRTARASPAAASHRRSRTRMRFLAAHGIHAAAVDGARTCCGR